MTTTSIDIDRPPEQVYAYVTDPTRFHEWQQGVVSGGLKEPGPPAVGSHCQMVRRIGGADRPSTSVLTKLDPAELASLSDQGTIRLLDLLILQKSDDGAIEAFEIDDFEVTDELRHLEMQIAEILAADDVIHLAESMESGTTPQA